MLYFVYTFFVYAVKSSLTICKFVLLFCWCFEEQTLVKVSDRVTEVKCILWKFGTWKVKIPQIRKLASFSKIVRDLELENVKSKFGCCWKVKNICYRKIRKNHIKTYVVLSILCCIVDFIIRSISLETFCPN